MKARKQQQQSVRNGKAVRLIGTGPYHGHPIRLTIALIVKDEEKTLDRCLSSLQPLRDAVESELIITDTGSTDRTVEIARKYTDRILFFKWCDDFSAARNTGVNAARGEWFLFLDGDEWFENTNELIAFFTSGECDRYGSATYIQRNYADSLGEQYNDFSALRLTKVYPGFCFSHIIHEDFPRLLPTKILHDYVHHYGYVYGNEAELLAKQDRNVSLLKKALEKDPEDLKMLYQLSREFFATGETAQVREYAERGLNLERKHPDLQRRLMLHYNILRALFKESKFESVLRYMDTINSEFAEKNIFWLDFDYTAQMSAMEQKDYERSVSYGEAYLSIWDRREAGELDPNMELSLDFNYILPQHREQVILWMLQADLKLKRYAPVAETLDAMTFSEKSSFQYLPGLVCEYCSQAGDWEQLPTFYRAALSSQGRVYWKTLIAQLEISLSDEPEKNREAASLALAALEDDGDAYVRLSRLRMAEARVEREAAMRELNWFFQWDGEWDPSFSDTVFFGMWEKTNLTVLFRKIETEDVKSFVDAMRKRHGDFENVAMDYLASASTEDLAALFWAVCIRESLILGESSEEEEEREDDKIQLFQTYAGEYARYVRRLYRTELLTPERVSVLPRAHRFGYFMGCALSAQNRRDGVSYLSNLRLALHSYPVMEHQVSILLKRFERKNREEQGKAEEFRSLAGQVKKNIRALIAQGRLEEAGRFTVQLARMMPNDPDIVEFRSLTHTEPDLNELAARLPQ